MNGDEQKAVAHTEDTEAPAARPRIITGQCTLSDEILRAFTKPGDPILGNLLAKRHLRGDLTQSCEDRMRRALGEEAYAHWNWDTQVCTGGILLRVPRFRHPEAVEPPMGWGFPAEWSWCFSQIEAEEDILAIRSSRLKLVVPESREKIGHLPNVEFLEVARVNFWSHGRGAAKRKSRPAPKEVVFFRFDGGAGCVAVPVAAKKGGQA